MLDLRANFVTRETAIVEYDSWRKRALELEVKLQEVEQRYQNEHVGEYMGPTSPLWGFVDCTVRITRARGAPSQSEGDWGFQDEGPEEERRAQEGRRSQFYEAVIQ